MGGLTSPMLCSAPRTVSPFSVRYRDELADVSVASRGESALMDSGSRLPHLVALWRRRGRTPSGKRRGSRGEEGQLKCTTAASISMYAYKKLRFACGPSNTQKPFFTLLSFGGGGATKKADGDRGRPLTPFVTSSAPTLPPLEGIKNRWH